MERPERIVDLSVHQVGRAFEIAFTRPKLATDGQLLNRPIEVEIFRRITAPGELVPAALPPTGPWAHLAGEELARDTDGGIVRYSDRLTLQAFEEYLGHTFTFQVRALTRGFRGRPIESEPSNLARATLLDVCRPPDSPRVEPTEHALKLSWPAPAVGLDGRAPCYLSGYRIDRSEGEKPGPFRPVGQSQVPAYADRHFEFGHTYFYRVAAILKSDGQVAESGDSPVVSITPQDVFPPQAPSGLIAVYSAGEVELVWNANTEADLAGYNVYRWERRTSPEKINTQLVRTPIYRDRNVECGQSYSYRVTAVDLAGNESLPSETVTVEAR